MQRLIFICSLFVFASCYSLASPVNNPTVTLDSGVYEGLSKKLPGATNEIHIYLGVPYATPPTRFAPPQALPPSSAVRKAQDFAPACLQAKNTTVKESEDCLYLNIYSPVPNGRNNRAVMIFLYGGGLQSGEGALDMYDGSSFAANQDVIIVVPNYRTNGKVILLLLQILNSLREVFGFPGDAPVIASRERNLGFLDQRIAFDFVQKHISKFGGDPNKVTIFGQSAGARSADFHILTMPNPPFRAVIMESGSAELVPLADIRNSMKNLSTTPPFNRLAAAVGCDIESPSLLDCVRKIPAAKIKDIVVSQNLYFPCVNDGGFTTVKDEAVVRKSGKAAKVPILMGTNSNEQTTTVKGDPIMSLVEYLSKIFPYPELSEKVKATYDVGKNTKYLSSFDAISAVETDFAYTCLTSREAKISAESDIRTYIHIC
jgi:carboxylesterase type B